MSKHKQRMSDISKVVVPPSGTPEGEAIRKYLKEHPPSSRVSQEVSKRWKVSTARFFAQLQNGASLPIDERIRSFLHEFNSRNSHYGLTSMPSSFNILEAFVKYQPENNYFFLREEQDHLLSFTDFLDYATSPDCPSDIQSSAKLYKDGVIYSYNCVNDPGETTFSVAPNIEYCIGGISIVRHSNELNVLLLCGEKTNLEMKTKELKEMVIDKSRSYPGKEDITPCEGLKREAVPLLGNSDYWQVIALARYDLDDMTGNARYVLKDAGDSFIVLTDDVGIYLDPLTGKFIKSEYETQAKSIAEQVDKHAIIFELCKTLLQLSSYCEHHVDSINIERHPTTLRDNIKNGSWITMKKYLTPDETIMYRNVSIIQNISKLNANKTVYRAPEFRIETSGYWKTLSLHDVGEDKHGNQIHGRTWVKKELSWIQKDPEPVMVQANNCKISENNNQVDANLENAGFIYILHNPAHEKDVFKVGLTRRNCETRSEELSGTGAPDKFLVAHEWQVMDCVNAEKIIHDALEPYRMNPTREFFKLPYKELLEIIYSISLLSGYRHHITRFQA